MVLPDDGAYNLHVTDPQKFFFMLLFILLLYFGGAVGALRVGVGGLNNHARFPAPAHRRNDRQKPGLTGSGM
jgi:hypothetical protein